MFKNSLKTISRGWSQLTGTLLGDRFDHINPDLADGDETQLLKQLEKWINVRGGEVSARKQAMQIGELYLHLSQEGRLKFMLILALEFGTDRTAIRAQCQNIVTSSDTDYGPAVEKLRDLLVSQRLKLLRQFNTLPQGIKFLVDLRKDLLTFCREDKRLLPLDREIKRLLATWFDVGLLEMRQIDWQSPAALLEKLISYEAVHEIDSWQDLRHRLNMDRRCYAFFHPSMPDEPLIFVEVALTNGISESIQTLLDEKTPDISPEEADTAIFYSISNAQKGLQGISFGNFLIKRVVDSLKTELPNIKTFSTLSPVPGFTTWLQSLSSVEVAELLGDEGCAKLRVLAQRQECETDIVKILNTPNWHLDPQITELVQPMLEKLLFSYFHSLREDDSPIDPVQRFHLGNGARIERTNWLGDVSEKGFKQAYGFMVNYLYPIKEIEKNHELFVTKGKIVISSTVKSLK